MYNFLMKKYICKNINKITAALLSIAMLVSLTSCSLYNPNAVYKKSGFYMDTIITITLYGNVTDPEDKLNGCMDLISMYEGYFSNTIEDSDIWRINSNPFEYIEVHDETIELLNEAIYYCGLSNGVFDISIGKLSDLWNISGGNTDVPDSDEINALKDEVDYKNIIISGNTVCLNSDKCKIDLGGIAKGYITDKIKEYLLGNDVNSALINLGGNITAIGPENKTGYNVGIQKPFANDGTVITDIMLKDKTIVSSGCYQRYFEKDGRIYHHILDPRTGYPAESDILSVSIICDSSVRADALSTISFIMGYEDASSYIESTDDCEAIFILSDYSIQKTSGLN